jgi:hypothetical protein
MFQLVNRTDSELSAEVLLAIGTHTLLLMYRYISPYNRPRRTRRWTGCVFNPTPRALYPRERPSTHCIGGWVAPGPVLNVQKISLPPGFSPWTVQPVAIRFTDWAISAHPTPFSFTSQANYIERKCFGIDGRCNSIDNESQMKWYWRRDRWPKPKRPPKNWY